MQLHQIIDQTAIRTGILRSADLVNECISHVQFMIDGKVSNQEYSMV